MRLDLMFGGQRIGTVELGAPDSHGSRSGLLEPTPAYLDARPHLQKARTDVAGLHGASAEDIRAHVIRSLAEQARRGLMLCNDEGQVPTTFLLVGDYYPADTPLEALAFCGVLVSATFS